MGCPPLKKIQHSTKYSTQELVKIYRLRRSRNKVGKVHLAEHHIKNNILTICVLSYFSYGKYMDLCATKNPSKEKDFYKNTTFISMFTIYFTLL